MAEESPSLATLETLVNENAALRNENALLRMHVQALESKQVVPPQFLKVLSSLAHSRKVLVALFAVIQALVLEYLSIPDAVWQSIAALAGVLILSISYEDGQEKSAPQTTIINSPTVTTEEPS